MFKVFVGRVFSDHEGDIKSMRYGTMASTELETELYFRVEGFVRVVGVTNAKPGEAALLNLKTEGEVRQLF